MCASSKPSPDRATVAAPFRLYAALVFSFAWVPVMYTAFTRDKGFTPDEYVELWSVYYLSMVVTEVPWGWVADRFGTRLLLRLGPWVLAVSFAMLGHGTSFGTCLAAMVVCGAAHAMVSGADSAYLYEALTAEGRRADALREEALASRSRLVGVSIADLLGGFVAFSLGTLAAFDMSVVIMVGAGLAALRLPAVPPVHGRPPPSLAGLRSALGQRGVLWIIAWYIALFVLVRIGFQLYQPTLLAIGAEDLRLHGGMFSLLNVVAAASALFVARAHLRWGEAPTAIAVILLVALSFGGLSVLGTGVAVTLLFSLQQISFGFLQPVGRTALNHRIPSSDRASVLSAQSMLARLAFAGVLAIGSWDAALGAHLDRTYAVLAAGALGLGLLLACLHPRRRVRDRP